MAARPSAVHENISFNTKVGMDLVSWRNSKGKEFHLVHFIDEATLFHLGAECLQGATGVIGMFELVWVTWAGQPSVVAREEGPRKAVALPASSRSACKYCRGKASQNKRTHPHNYFQSSKTVSFSASNHRIGHKPMYKFHCSLAEKECLAPCA